MHMIICYDNIISCKTIQNPEDRQPNEGDKIMSSELDFDTKCQNRILFIIFKLLF